MHILHIKFVPQNEIIQCPFFKPHYHWLEHTVPHCILKPILKTNILSMLCSSWHKQWNIAHISPLWPIICLSVSHCTDVMWYKQWASVSLMSAFPIKRRRRKKRRAEWFSAAQSIWACQKRMSEREQEIILYAGRKRGEPDRPKWREYEGCQDSARDALGVEEEKRKT